MTSTRRDFLKQTAALGSLASIPYFSLSRSGWAQDANSRPTVASIGVGGKHGRYSRGGTVARQAGKLGQMIAVCDVDAVHTEQFNASFDNKLNMYEDYRDLLAKEKPDVVTIGTPDHWHVPISIAALRAGCDVYCEKPLTLTIEEGILIRKVVEQTGRVFQVGTQQRSEFGSKFLRAVAIVRSGVLGDSVNAYLAIGGAPGDGPFEAAPVPEGLNWDLWLGPTPKRDYMEQRRRMFRWWFDYSGGKMTDWGAHHIDIAQWALGCDHTGPVRVNAKGKFPSIVPEGFAWRSYLDGKTPLPAGYNTATNFQIELEFASGSTMTVADNYQRESDNTNFGNGILFEGDRGRIFVNRGKLEGKPIQDMTEADNKAIDDKVVELYHGKKPSSHMANFFESLETRKQPISDVVTHHRTMTSCHLCNISLMLGRELKWNPEAEQFINDPEATALLTRDRRKPYALEG